MQNAIRIRRLVVLTHFNFEKAGTAAAVTHFFFARFPHGFHFQVQTQRDA